VDFSEGKRRGGLKQKNHQSYLTTTPSKISLKFSPPLQRRGITTTTLPTRQPKNPLPEGNNKDPLAGTKNPFKKI